MSDAPLETTGSKIAVAIAAGKLVTTKDSAATAVKDRYEALKRAIVDKSDKIRVAPVEEDPASAEHREALAKDLEEYGAGNDKKVVNTAKELLSLLKLEESARDAIGESFAEIEESLTGLSELDVDAFASPSTGRKNTDRSSARLVAEEPSRTELERLALPIWQRTERFFFKLGLLVAVIVAGGIGTYVWAKKPANELIEGCQNGDKAKCWQSVISEDTESLGQHITAEPLERLCESHKDACACAGLAYLNATSSEDSADCANLDNATKLDPKWPCTCTRYGFWKAGELKTQHCGIPRCN